MTKYSTIVVGTDGSETSLRAVDKAAALAAESDARLIIASAYTPARHDGGADLGRLQLVPHRGRDEGRARSDHGAVTNRFVGRFEASRSVSAT